MITQHGTGYINGESDVRCIPTNYRTARRPVLYFHGAGELSDGWMRVPSRCPLMAAISRSGRRIYCADLGGAQTWGNDTAVTRTTGVYDYVQTLSDVLKGKVHLLGQSMGNLNQLVWARTNSSKIASIVSIMGVMNLADIQANSSTYAPFINTAYGGTYSEASNGPTKNPITMARNGTLPIIPHLQWYGTGDTLCKPEFAAEFATLMGTVPRPVAGGHDDVMPTNINIAETLAFLDANEG